MTEFWDDTWPKTPQPQQEIPPQDTTLLRTVRECNLISWQVIFSLDHFLELLHSASPCRRQRHHHGMANLLLGCFLIFCRAICVSFPPHRSLPALLRQT